MGLRGVGGLRDQTGEAGRCWLLKGSHRHVTPETQECPIKEEDTVDKPTENTPVIT